MVDVLFPEVPPRSDVTLTFRMDDVMITRILVLYHNDLSKSLDEAICSLQLMENSSSALIKHSVKTLLALSCYSAAYQTMVHELFDGAVDHVVAQYGPDGCFCGGHAPLHSYAILGGTLQCLQQPRRAVVVMSLLCSGYAPLYPY